MTVTRIFTTTLGLVFALLIGCGAASSNGGDPDLPTGDGSTPMGSVSTGAKCVGLSNGVGARGSVYCKSHKCEKGTCVDRCSGPQDQDAKNGCEVSY